MDGALSFIQERLDFLAASSYDLSIKRWTGEMLYV